MKPKLYIFNFEKIFIKSDLNEINEHIDPTLLTSNLRNKDKLLKLLNDINVNGHKIIVFAECPNDIQSEYINTINSYLNEIISSNRTFLDEEDIYLLKAGNEINTFLNEVVLKFNLINHENIILESEFNRIVWVDSYKNRANAAKEKGCTTITVSEQNDDYLVEIKDEIKGMAQDLEKQWNRHVNYEESFWQRHKGKITLLGPLAVGALTSTLNITLGETGVLALLDNSFLNALLGFSIGYLPSQSLLGGMYLYNTHCQKPPTIQFKSISEYGVSIYSGITQTLSKGASSLISTAQTKDKDRQPNEETPLIEPQSMGNGLINQNTRNAFGLGNPIKKGQRQKPVLEDDSEINYSMG